MSKKSGMDLAAFTSAGRRRGPKACCLKYYNEVSLARKTYALAFRPTITQRVIACVHRWFTGWRR